MASAPDRKTTVVQPQLPSLATLASVAAIALDKRVHGIDVPLDPVFELATALREVIEDSTEPSAPGGVRASFHDPLTVDLLGRALHSSSVGGELRSVEELVEKATEMTERLASSDKDSAQEYGALRDFCIALSRAAQARYAATHLPPRHPYRR
jgi:hypothetical protein